MSETEMNNVNNNPKFGIGLGIIKDETKSTNYNQNYSSDKNINAENKVLELKNLNHSYFQGEQEIKVLDNVDLTLYKGEITALVAPSGVGKSTLLHIAGLLCSPLSGQIIIKGQDCSKLNDDKLTKLRRDYIGFVYQHHYLLNEFSALENVEMPQIIASVNTYEAKIKALALLEKLGVKDRAKHRPSALSGGERQRVAIARALANSPKLLLADEPTGNLDPKIANIVFNELLKISKENGVCVLVATHNPELARKCDKIIGLEQGRIVPLTLDDK